MQPGEELVIAMMGIDHREYNSRSFDLSKADFEFFDDDAAGTIYPDTDGPTVPNLDKWYSKSLTVSDFHNRGSMTVAIARMQGTKEDFLLNIVLYFIRKKQKTLFFVFRCEAPMNFILMVNWLRKTKEP